MPIGISSDLSLPNMLGNMSRTPPIIQRVGAYLFKMMIPSSQFFAFSTTLPTASVSKQKDLN